MTNEQMLELAKKTINETPGFIKHNNYKVEEVTNEHCKMSVELTEDAINPNGTAHGGLMFGLADTTMGLLVRTTGRNVTTINAQIDYLKPENGSKIICIAEPLKVGKSTAVYRANIYNEEEILISTVTGTFFFLD
jgi:acyl-CoA thioesterase